MTPPPTPTDLTHSTHRTHAERLSAYHARRARDRNGGKWNGSWSARQWQNLLAAYDYRCAYCHQPFPPDKLTPDHRTPLSRGGVNAIRNIVPACARCNSRKGRRTEAEYSAYLILKESLMLDTDHAPALDPTLLDLFTDIRYEVRIAAQAIREHDRDAMRASLHIFDRLGQTLDDVIRRAEEEEVA